MFQVNDEVIITEKSNVGNVGEIGKIVGFNGEFYQVFLLTYNRSCLFFPRELTKATKLHKVLK